LWGGNPLSFEGEGEINKKRGETPLKHPTLEVGERIVFEGASPLQTSLDRQFIM